jgi:hypothetical protein
MESTIVERGVFTEEVHQRMIAYLDEQVPYLSVGLDTDNFTRRFMHNNPFFMHVHGQLTEFASEMCGEKLKPSYSFLSMYDEHGICPLHIDRPQCYKTIDYLIRQSPDEPWPIYVGGLMTDEEVAAVGDAGHPDTAEAIGQIKKDTDWNKVDLMPNDAVIYSGTHSWHYRDRLSEGTADLVFFHFVPEGFDGELN